MTVGRNNVCPCGSGLKFKKCCQAKKPLVEPPARMQRSPRPLASSGARATTLLAVANGHWAAGRSSEAIACFRQIVQLEPQNADANYNLGAALFGNGQLAEATVVLKRAVELRPSFEAALRTLAAAAEHLGKESEAAELYWRISRLTKDPVDRRLTSAKALSLKGDADAAEIELRRAISVAPGNTQIQVNLGQLLMETGQFEEAERYLKLAIEDYPDAFQQLAGARPITELDRPLIDRMSALLEQSDLNRLQRRAIHFGLGKAYDDLRDYAEAMRHFEVGNALTGAAARLDRAGLLDHYDRLIADHSAAALDAAEAPERNDPGADDDLPVLIVGMPRSGTTLAEQILSSHPEVVGGGELSFWSDRVKQWMAASKMTLVDHARSTPGVESIAKLLASRPARTAVEKAARETPVCRTPGPRLTDRGLLSQAGKDYVALLRRIGPQARRVIDKAPHNFERLGHIRAALPTARIIHCRRQPIDTCLSIFFTNYKGRQAWSREDLLFQYRQYQRLMDHWRAVLPADRFIELDYEAIIADREGQTRRLVAFCGLEWSDACLAPEKNQRVVKSASLWQARQPTYTRSLDRWRRYEPWLGELRELLPDGPR